jgi:hypothetical protein
MKFFLQEKFGCHFYFHSLSESHIIDSISFSPAELFRLTAYLPNYCVPTEVSGYQIKIFLQEKIGCHFYVHCLPESHFIDKVRFCPAVFFVSGSAKTLLRNKWRTQCTSAGASNSTLQAPAVVQISITLNVYFS